MVPIFSVVGDDGGGVSTVTRVIGRKEGISVKKK